MTYPEFEARWRTSGGAEHSNYGLFLQDLCELLGVPKPNPKTDRPAEDIYVFERGVYFNDGGKKTLGRIDLYKRNCFVLETKQGVDGSVDFLGSSKKRAARDVSQQSAVSSQQSAVSSQQSAVSSQQSAVSSQQSAVSSQQSAVSSQQSRRELGLAPEKRRQGHATRGTARWEQMMQTARQQALNYARALPADEPRPAFIIVVDVGYCIDLYANFAGVGDSFIPFPDQSRFRIPLAALATEETRALLRQVFLDPQQLDPSRRSAQVTRELAGYLAGISSQLERAGYAPNLVAHFLMRCLFSMFAEDVGLIPQASFTGLLQQYATPELRQYLPEALQNLWQKMDTGGFSSELKARVPRFNGKLFHNATALPLTADQMELLLKAAKADWKEVEPAIFGTLLERALDPKERHRLGAHYTPRRYVERLIFPTVIDPLRREWAAVQAASALRLEAGKQKEAKAELLRFHRRLTSLRILDPACGSGNFLYVTLEHLKRLEGEVLTAIGSHGHSGVLDFGGGATVSPRQFLGLELNPRAAAVADVVLRIGYLQWHLRTHGATQLAEPLLDDYQNIRQQDAVLTYETGFQNARPTEWPQADFIIGNPPFVGDKAMRGALGDAYVEALRKTYKGLVPESADLVMYWWEKAAEIVRQNNAEAFGFITTNSITQTFNRRLIQRHLDATPPLCLAYAIADHPWVDSAQGAAVRIALSVGRTDTSIGKLLQVVKEVATDEDDAHSVDLVEVEGIINADFTVGADVAGASLLKANKDLVNVGMGLYGAGFLVTLDEAKQLGLGIKSGLEKHIRPYVNGRDLSQKSRGYFVIDLFGLQPKDVIEKYPEIYQRVFDLVKPERDKTKDKSTRENWWQFGRPRSELRPALSGLKQMIVTTRTARHRIFSFLPADTIPDAKIVVAALEDPYYLGVLSSRTHTEWAAAAGGWLGVGNDATYNHSDCFLKFPFPNASPAQQAHIRELAKQLDAHRKRQQSLHPKLTLTDLYNVVEKLRAGQPLTAKDQQVNQQGLASVVLSLHQQLDTAVAEAYGWSANLPEAELLQRLVRLNHERAREEAAGRVRYLRPSYQAPELAQVNLALPTMVATDATAEATQLQVWPAELAQQMQAVWATVQQAGQPISPAQVANQFRRTRAEKIRPLLDTLAALALLRCTAEGVYTA